MHIGGKMLYEAVIKIFFGNELDMSIDKIGGPFDVKKMY